jgi:hypothetical protein
MKQGINIGIKGHRNYNEVKREVLKNGLEEIGEEHYDIGKSFNLLISQGDLANNYYERIVDKTTSGFLEKKSGVALAFPYMDLFNVRVKVRYFSDF